MYKITIGGLITVDRVLNDLVITSINGVTDYQSKVKFDIIYKGCDGNKTIVSVGTDIEGYDLNSTYSLPFFSGQYLDGVYTFKLYYIDYNTSYAREVTIYNYGKTLTRAITEFKLNVCKKCGCEECACNQAGTKCIKFTSVHNKLQRYLYSNRPFVISPTELYMTEIYNFLAKSYIRYNCDLNAIACCSSINTKINGEVSYNEKETRFHISMLYVAIYFHHKYSISSLTEDEIDSLNTYFNLPNIKRCLEESVEFSELEQLFVGGNTGGDYINLVSVLGSSPLTGEQGVDTIVNITTNIISNDDTITSAILRSNGVTIYNLLSTVDQGLQTLPIADISVSTTFELIITYIRSGVTMTETKETEYSAFVPQWYGKNSRMDYDNLPYGTINGELLKVVQESSTIEVNINPTSQYIHFISIKSNALISNSGFNVTIGDWNSTTSAFIKKAITVNLVDGSEVTMTLYRSRTLMTHSLQTYKIY